jgi:polyphosphate kinase
LQLELRELLDVQLGDNCGAWEMDCDGSYLKRPPGEGAIHSQQVLLERAISQSGRAHPQAGQVMDDPRMG